MTALRAVLAKPHAAVNVAEEDGTTALHWAAHWNDAAMVDLLIHAGADAKAVNRYGATPLSEAAALGNAVLIEALLKAGADPNTRTTSDGETILMATARTGNAEAVKALLDHGANVNAMETYRGQTALMWAAAERHPEVVKLLLAHGADWKIHVVLPRDQAAQVERGILGYAFFPRRFHCVPVYREGRRHRYREGHARCGTGY